MAYKITHDYITKKLNFHNTTSYTGKGRFRKVTPDGIVLREVPLEDMPHRFRLKDDDGMVYLAGASDDSSSFAPLDDYINDLGVTEIEYKNPNTGIWELL